MDYFFRLCFLFFIGSTLGWVLELFFRRIVHKTWVKPGFLSGPYLPIYGFGLVFLYVLSSIPIPIKNVILKDVVIILILAAAMTLIEYITGIIFIKKLKVKLWDYSGNWGNVQGIICPLFSFFWAVISAIYYFFINPHVILWTEWLTSHYEFLFIVGIFYGVLIIDVVHSMNIVSGIRHWAKEKGVVVKYERLKEAVNARKKLTAEKIYYFSPFKSQKKLDEELENYSQSIAKVNQSLKKDIKKDKRKNSKNTDKK